MELLHLLDASELQQGCPAGLFGRHAGPQVVLHVHVQMARQLLGELPFSPFPIEESEGTDPERPPPRHHDSFGLKKHARMAAVRCQSRASFSTRLRPARVSR